MSETDLITLWRNCKLQEAPYIYPNDNFPTQDKKYFYKNFEEYLEKKEVGKRDSKLHLGLLPMPYIGDLINAKIFILMLNPGFSPSGYIVENDEYVEKELLRNLTQNELNKVYPNVFLNPDMILRTNDYWHKRFKETISKYAEKHRYTYKTALSIFSQKIAIAQYVPYHSHSFGLPKKIYRNLASVKDISDYMKQRVKDDILTIVVRGVNKWNIEKSDNTIIYDTKYSRGGYLTQESKEKILEYIEK